MREKKKTQSNRTKEFIVESLKIPRDIVMGDSILTVTGNHCAHIENYRGILEYNTCHILIQAKHCQICFEGNGLHIDYYTNEDMKISGCISNIQYI